jgi:CDP-glucose 4,6-dehydratase
MKLDKSFWKDKKVFLTGHTGFKGGWLSLWLSNLGCEVYGYALAPSTEPSFFDAVELSKKIHHHIADIRDYKKLSNAINEFQPDIVFHLAAQPLVRYSYQNPIETYETNVMGSVNLLEAVRHYGKAKATIVVTSDKCYENKEQLRGYREDDPMGGHDPYSNSKGCTELVVASYAKSYFIQNPQIGKLASVRAGNVIGGGDWSQDRLIPDLVKSLVNKQDPIIRSPNAIRPWQHVLEPVYGYMIIAQYLCDLERQNELLNWNFGPDISDQRNVKFVADSVCKIWGGKNKPDIQINKNNLHEANLLYLDCAKVKKELDWSPRWNVDNAISETIKWYKAYYSKSDMTDISIIQIESYKNT